MSESQKQREAQVQRVIEERINALPPLQVSPLPDLTSYREEVLTEILRETNKQPVKPNP